MKKTLLFIVCLLSVRLQAQVSTFSFNINGAPPQGFAQALAIAGQKWSDHLQITVPVKVNVFTVNSTLLPFSAITLANGRSSFSNAPLPNILYVSALANQLAGTELNAGEFDMDIYFNLATPFYYGTGKPSMMQQDFITTAMHEIGHGLGFYSDGYVDASGKGSFGNIPPSAIFPLTPSFPWRGLDGVPSIYDKYIVRVSDNPLVTCAPANSTNLGDSIKNGALYFSGPQYANPSHANAPVRLAGGEGTFTLGIDLLHIHDTYAETIMSYYWGYGDTVRIPAAWEIGILKEIGWRMHVVGVEETGGHAAPAVYPNPANTGIHISGRNIRSAKLYTLLGELCATAPQRFMEEEAELQVSGLPEGIYFLKIGLDADREVIRKIIVRH